MPHQLQQAVLIQAAQSLLNNTQGGARFVEETTQAGRQYMAEAMSWQLAGSLIRRVSNPEFLHNHEDRHK